MEKVTNANISQDSSLLTTVLRYFQEQYQLRESDGEITNETLSLMKQRRCGVRDNLQDFAITPYKWNKTVITWDFRQANSIQRFIANSAFSLWSKHSNLTFRRAFVNPDILISFQRGRHTFGNRTRGSCSFNLDGQGGHLAHAYFPKKSNEQVEIHLDGEEKWWYTKKRNDSETSLLQVLTHEIGHSLGLSHTNVYPAIMYPFYFESDDGNLDLYEDDINGIQFLYGENKKQVTLTSTAPTTSTAVSTVTMAQHPSTSAMIPRKNETIPDLCRIKNLRTFLILKSNLYIFYKKWVWTISLNSFHDSDKFKKYSQPQKISDWLSFLPKNFSKIDFIYQKPNTDVVLFIKDHMYTVKFPSFHLKEVRTLLSVFGQYSNGINGIINSYEGRTYLFLKNQYVAEINECDNTILMNGYINEHFPGAPSDIKSVFRYVNGYLYFFTRNYFYEYDAFTKRTLRTSELNGVELFGVSCPRESILNQLYSLVSRLFVLQSNEQRDYTEEGEEEEEEQED